MSGRCRACNVVLNEDEMTARDVLTGDYTDICFRCTALAEGQDYEEDYNTEKEEGDD